MAKEDNPRWMLSRSQKVLELAAHLRIEELAEQLKAERGRNMKREGDWAGMAASYRRAAARIRERQEILRKQQRGGEASSGEREKLEKRIRMLKQEEREMVEKVAAIEEYLR